MACLPLIFSVSCFMSYLTTSLHYDWTRDIFTLARSVRCKIPRHGEWPVHTPWTVAPSGQFLIHKTHREVLVAFVQLQTKQIYHPNATATSWLPEAQHSFISQPPSYKERSDIELGSLPGPTSGIRFHQTGNTMKSTGGYHDYEPNASHHPNHQFSCNGRLVQKKRKKSIRRKLSVSVWHLGSLCSVIVLLVALLAVCAGMLVARRWIRVRTGIVINGVAVNDTTLWFSTVDFGAATVTVTVTDLLTHVETQTLSPSAPSSSSSSSSRTTQPPTAHSLPAVTVSKTVQYTVTDSGISARPGPYSNRNCCGDQQG